LAQTYGTTPRQVRAWLDEEAPLTDLENVEEWFAARRTRPADTMKLLADNGHVVAEMERLNGICGYCLTSAWHSFREVNESLSASEEIGESLAFFSHEDGDQVWHELLSKHRKAHTALTALCDRLRLMVEVKRGECR